MDPIVLGPVELLVVPCRDEQLPAATLDALAIRVSAGIIRVLDVLVVRCDEQRMRHSVEIDADGLLPFGVELVAQGLVALDDAAALIHPVNPGERVALIAVELVWEQSLHQDLADAGLAVLASAHVPAVVANAVLERAEDE